FAAVGGRTTRFGFVLRGTFPSRPYIPGDGIRTPNPHTGSTPCTTRHQPDTTHPSPYATSSQTPTPATTSTPCTGPDATAYSSRQQSTGEPTLRYDPQPSPSRYQAPTATLRTRSTGPCSTRPTCRRSSPP